MDNNKLINADGIYYPSHDINEWDNNNNNLPSNFIQNGVNNPIDMNMVQNNNVNIHQVNVGYPVVSMYNRNQYRTDDIIMNNNNGYVFNNYGVGMNYHLAQSWNNYLNDRIYNNVSKSSDDYNKQYDESNIPVRPIRVDRDYITNNPIFKTNLSFKEAASAMLSMDFPTSKQRKKSKSSNKSIIKTIHDDITDTTIKINDNDSNVGTNIHKSDFIDEKNRIPIKNEDKQHNNINTHINNVDLQPSPQQPPPQPQQHQHKLNVVEEINLEKNMIPIIKRNLLSSASIMMETFQHTLANKKRRIRNCLVEDCRQVIGEQPKMDIQYRSIDVNGDKYYYLNEVISTLLPYHLFYYEDFMKDHVPYVGNDNENLSMEITELTNEIDDLFNNILTSEEIQRSYKCIKNGLDVTNELILNSRINDDVDLQSLPMNNL